LRDCSQPKVKVLVVWEPILFTDIQPPSTRELERVSDERASQFWDKNGTVSRAIAPPIVARGQDDKRRRYRTKGEMLWDTVAIYPAGTQWGDRAPDPAYTGGPVVTVASDLRTALQKSLAP
jgi:hypothetical protein